ncbi:MAG TPA: Type 1 glutamine amidotransferase-like domain-containing protein [Burkholderiales bacterium]|nr:Type 1 glutamine amidotransferase-like domain-containing protein [Burkholderiales bacterium]
MTRRIIAIGGGGFLMERGPSLLDEYFVRTAGVRNPKVCFISTAAGDPEDMLAKYYKAFSQLVCRPSHLAFFRKPRQGSIPLDGIERGLLAQDAIYVGGGNTRSMLAVWREWDRKLPRNVDSLEVELSGTIEREGGSNEALEVYGTADHRGAQAG